MHYTGSLQTVSRKSIQVAMLAGVAATGIAFGRWAIPAEHSSPSVTVTRVAPAPTKLAGARAEQKLVQMDQADERAYRAGIGAGAPANRAKVAPAALSPAERKLLQMDQADERIYRASIGAAPADRPNVAPASLSPTERKLIQMDQADERAYRAAK